MIRNARLRRSRGVCSREKRDGRTRAAEPFPPAPGNALDPGAFVDRMVEAVFVRSAKLYHPFAERLGRGELTRDQVREWARQEYPRTVFALRRHALIAANATDYETLWGLITRVKIEADADAAVGTS